MTMLDFKKIARSILPFHGNAAPVTSHNIQCGNAPFDLRPAADLIVDCAREQLRTARDGKPVVIVMGEMHRMSSHILLEQMVAERLVAASEKPTIAIEYPHNLMGQVLRLLGGEGVPDALYYETGFMDTDGKGSLATLIGHDCPYDAPLAHDGLMTALFQSEASCTFNDAAAVLTLDTNDPMTAIAAQGHGATPEQTLYGYGIAKDSPEGLAVRNSVMAHFAINKAQEQDTRLILQLTGQSHVFGDRALKASFEQSLSAAYHAAGANVLPVIHTQDPSAARLHRMIPLPEGRWTGTGVTVHGLASDTFTQKNIDEELPFIERVIRCSGDEIKLHTNNERSRKGMREFATERLNGMKSAMGAGP